MSYNNTNVPVIAITPDDGLNDFDTERNIDEVATDVEDIYFQTEKRKKKSKRHNIKKDAYATDVEDMEGSDDDTISPLVKHPIPLSLSEIMLAEETPVVEESFKSNQKTPRQKPKLKSQTSIAASKHFLELDDLDSYQVLTDLEDFDASDEDDEASDAESDSDLLKEIIHDSGSIAISDSVKKFLQSVPSPMITPDVSENETQKKSNSKSLKAKKPCRHYISPSSISPHLSDITDTEMIHYDSNDEMKGCKQKHKYASKGRRHTSPGKYRPDTTDSDQDESETDITALRRVTVADLGEIEKLKIRDLGGISCTSKTIHEIESDEEENNATLYPVKRNITKKSSNTLNVEVNPDEGVTDTEDIEGEKPEEYSYDESAINLNDYENSDGVIQEIDSVKLSKNLNKLAETRVYKSKQEDSNEESTDEEEDVVAEGNQDDTVEITDDINIKFVRNKKATPLKKKIQEKPTNNLCLPQGNDEALTDVENLNSSDSENENENEIPITIVNNDSVDNETDSESVEGEVQIQCVDEIDEKCIPPAIRKLIREVEVGDNKFSVVSSNINDEDLETDIINNKTDVEDFSGDEIEDEKVEYPPVEAFELGDVEKIDHKDSLNVPNCEDTNDGETDIEDIEDIKKPIRPKRSKRLLYVENDDNDKLTDVEDLIINDNTGNDFLGVDNPSNAKTDVEDFDASDNEQEQPVPEYCRTPDIMRQMGGESVCSQEGSGHFSNQDRKKLNEKHRSFSIPEISPSPTLTDEFMASADDEIYTRTETVTPSQMTQALDEMSHQNIHSQSSKKFAIDADEDVMYLKGGGFLPDAITDTEEMGISDEEYLLANEANKKVWLNITSDQNNQVFKVATENEENQGMSVINTAVKYSLENNDKVDKMLVTLTISCSKLGYKTKMTINHIPTYITNTTMLHINYPKSIEIKTPIYSSKCYMYVEKYKSEIKKISTRSNSLNNTHMTKSSFGTDNIPYFMKFRSGSVTKLVAKYEPIKNKLNKKFAPQVIAAVAKTKSNKDIKKTLVSNIAGFLQEIKQVNRRSSTGTQRVIEKAKHFETLMNKKTISEWGPAKGTSSAGESVGEAARDAAHQGARFSGNQRSLGASCSKPSTHSSHTNTSYTQLDKILDHMLAEVDEQERLVHLDESDKILSSICVNSIKLDPATDAIIEIPITNIPKSPKIYETKHEFQIDFGEDLDDEISSIKTLNKSQDTDSLFSFESISEMYFLENINNRLRASSESLGELETNNFTVEDEHIYEIIEPVDNVDHSQEIWWEGTYRDLSIVPEEDEDNISEILVKNAIEDSSSGDEFIPSQNKPVKAEVKLLVKTLDRGKEDVEIRTVREFTDNTNFDRYPQSKPSFTLQRLFVRCPDSTPICKNYPELVAASNTTYPLQYDPNQGQNPNSNVDLYANTPFFPCYGSYENNTSSQSFPTAYCDWLLQPDETPGGKTTSPSIVVSDTLSHDVSKTKIVETIADPGQLTPKSPDQDKASKELDNKKEKSKSKGGFFSSLKSLVGRSFDSSDSESTQERTPKKKKRKDKGTPKKDKKPKQQDTSDTSPEKSGKPSSPIKEVPKALYESKMDNIPAIDETEVNVIQVTDLDADPITTDEVKVQATTIVDNVIKDSKKAASHILNDKIQEFNLEGTVTPEEVRRSTEPIIINEDEFLVVIEPKLNDDYEDIQNPDTLIDKTTLKPDETEGKSDTLKSRKSTGFMKLFGKKDSKESDDESRAEDHKHSLDKPDKQEEHRKSGFFGLFSKKSKDDDKKEECKDIILKEEPGIEYSKEIREFSPEVQQQMVDTSNFLMSEIEYFEDVRPVIKKTEAVDQETLLPITDHVDTQQKMVESADFLLKEVEFFEDVRPQPQKPIVKEEAVKTTCLLAEHNLSISPTVQQEMVDSAHFLRNEIEMFEDVRPKIEIKETSTVSEGPKSIKSPDNKLIEFSPDVQQQMVDSADFLMKEVEFFEDVKIKSEIKAPVAPNTTETKEAPTPAVKQEKSKEPTIIKKEDDVPKEEPLQETAQTETKPQGFFSKLGFGSKSVDKKDETKEKKKQKKKKEKKPGFFTKFGEKFSSSSQEDKNYLSSDDDSKLTKPDGKDKKLHLNTNIEVDNVIEEPEEFKERSVTIIGKIMDDAKQATKDATEVMEDKTEQLNDNMKSTKDGLEHSLSLAKENVKDNIQNIEKSKDDMVNNVKDAVKDTTDKTNREISELKENINNIGETATDNLAAAKDISADKFKTGVEKVEDLSKESIEKTHDFLNDLDKQVKHAESDAATKLETLAMHSQVKMNDATTDIKDAMQHTNEKTEDAFKKAGEVIADEAVSAKESVIAAKNATIEKLKDGVEKAEDVTKETVAKTDDFLSGLSTKAKKAGSDIKDEIQSASETSKDKLKEGAANIKEGIQDKSNKTKVAFDEATETIKDKADSAKESIIAAKDNIIEKTKDGVEKTTDLAKESAEKTEGFLSSLGKKVKKAGKDTKDAVDNAAETSKDKIKDGVDTIKEGIVDTSDKTKDTLTKTSETIKEKADSAKETLIDTKDAGIEKVKEGAEKVEDLAKETAEKTGGFFSSLGKKAKKAGKDTKDAAKTVTEESKDKIKEGATNIKEGIENATDKTKDALSNAGETIKDKADSAKESLITTKDTSIEKVKENAEKVEDIAKESAEKTGGFFSSLTKKAKKTGKDTKDAVETAADTTKDKIKDGTTNIKESIENATDKTKDALSKTGETIKDKADSAKETLIDTKDAGIERVKEGAEKVEELAKDSAEKTGGFFSSLTKKAKKTGKDSKEAVETAAEATKDKIKDSAANMKEGIKETTDKTKDTLTKAGETIKDKAESAKETLIDTKDAGIEKAKEGAEKVEELAKDSVEKTGGFFSSLTKKAKKTGKDTKDAVETAADTTKDKIKDGTTNIKESIENATDKTKDALSKTGETIKDKADSAKETLIDTKDAGIEKVKEGAEKVEELAKDSAEKTGGFFSSLTKKAKKTGKDTKEAVETAAEATKDKIKDSAANMKEGIKDTTDKTKDTLTKAGETIKDKTESAKETLIDTKDAGIEKVKEGAEKVEELAKDSAEKTGGFFSGLTKKAQNAGKDTKDAVETAADATKDKIKDSAANIKEGIEETTDQTKDALTKAGESIKDKADSAKETLIVTKDTGIEKVKEGAEKIDDLVKDSAEKTEGFFSGLTKKAKKAGEDTKDAVETATDSSKEKIKEGATTIKEGIVDTTDKTKDALNEAGESIKDKAESAKESLIETKDAGIKKIKSGAEKVEDLAKDSAEKTEGFFSSLTKKAKKAGKDTKDAAETAADTTKDKIKDGAANIKDSIEDTKDKTKDALSKAGETIKDKADSAKETLIDTKDAGIEKVKDGAMKVEELAKDSAEKTGGFFSSLTKKAKKAGKDTKDAVDTSKDKIKEGAADIKEGIADTTDKTKDALNKAGETIKDKAESAKESFNDTIDTSKEKIKDSAEKVEDIAKESAEKTGGFFSSLTKKAKKAGKDTKDAVETAAVLSKDKIKEGTTNIKEGIEDTSDKTKDALGNAGEIIKDRADNAKESIIETKDAGIEKVKEGAEKVEDIAKVSAEKTGGFFSSLTKKAKKAGKNTKDVIENTAETSKDKLITGATNIKEGIEGTADKTKQTVNLAGETIKDKTENAKEHLIATKDTGIEKVKDGIEKIDDITKESVEKTDGFFSNLGKGLEKAGKDTKDKVVAAAMVSKDKIQDGAENIKECVVDKTDKTKETLNNVSETVKDKAEIAKESLISTKDTGIETVKDGVDKLEDLTKESIEKTGGFFSNLGEKTNDAGKNVKDAIESTAENTKEKIKDGAADIKEGIKDTTANTKDTLSKAGETIADKAESAKESLVAAKDMGIKKAKDGVEKVEDVTKETVEKTGGFFSNLGIKAKKAGKDAKDGIETTAEVTKEKIKDDAKDIKESIKDTTDKTKDSLSKAGETIVNKAESAKDSLVAAKDTGIENVKGGVEKVEDVTKDTVEKTGGFFSNLGKKAKKAGKDAKEGIETTAVVAKEKIKDGAEDIKESVKDTTDKTKDSLSKASETIVNKAESAKDSLGAAKDTGIENVKGGVEKVEDVTKDTVEKTGGFFSNLGKKAKKAGKDTKDEIESTVEVTKEKIKDGAEDIKEGLKDTTDKTKDSLSKAGETIADKADSAKDSLVAAKNIGIQKVNDGVEEVEDVTKESVEKTEGFFSNSGKKAKEAGKDAKGGIESTAEVTIETLKEGLKDTTAKTKDSLNKAGETIVDKAENAKDSLLAAKDTSIEKVKDAKQSIESSAQASKEKANELSGAASDKIETTFEKMKVFAKDGAEKPVEFLKCVRQESLDFPEETVEKTGGFFSNLGKKAKKAGKDAKDGLESTAEVTKEKIKDGVEDMKEGLKDTSNKAKDSLSKAGETIADKADNAKESLVAAKDTGIEKVKDGVEIVEDVTKETVEKTGGFFSNLGKKAKQAGKDAKGGIESTAEVTKEKVKDGATEIKVGLKDTADKTKESLSKVGEAIADKAGSAKDSLVSAKDTGIKNVKDGAEKVEDITKETVEKTGGFFSNLGNTAKQAGKDTKEAVDTAVEVSKDKIKEGTVNIKEGIIDTTDKTKETLNKAGEAIKNKADGAKESLITTKDTTVDKIKDGAEKTKDVTNEIVEKTDGFFSNLGKKAKKAFTETKDEIGTAAESAEEKSKQVTKDVADGIKSAAKTTTDKIHDVAENIKEAKDANLEKAKEAKDSTEHKLTDTKQAISEKLKDTTEKAEDITKDVAEKTGGFFSNLGKKTKKAGKDAKESLETSAEASKEKAKELSDAASDKIESTFEKMKVFTKDEAEKPVEFLKCVRQESLDAKEEAQKLTVDDINKATDFVCYVTTPTMQRKGIGGSQRIGKDNRPPLMDVSNMPADSSSDEDEYIVTEPGERVHEEHLSSRGSPIVIETIQECEEPEKDTGSSLGLDSKRKPLFHIGSRDEESISESVDLGDKSTPIDIIPKTDAQTDIDLIEDKLVELGKALDDLEKVNMELEPQDSQIDEKSERKLRRVERRFERMASETMEKDIKEAKEQQITSPEIEAKREEDFRTIVSQLSQEEVSECQKLYSTLWDDATFTPSEEWDSKTPDSQPDDIQDLPQGEVVYMAPVTLNKDHLINKAGIEVDVIPIKRSPCTSPLPKRKLQNKGRAKSAMGFYKENKQIEERGSLPDLQNTGKIIQKGSIMSAILKSNPNILKATSSSTNSVYFDTNSYKRRLSTDSLTKGNVVSAVKEWMARSTPFGSTDNIRSTDAISLADTTNSLFDDDDNDSVDLQSESVYHLESESSKSDQIPDILIYNDVYSKPTNFFDTLQYSNNQAGNDLGTSLTRRIMSSLDQYGLGETSGGPLTNLTKEGPTHLATNLEHLDQPAELTLVPKPKPRVDKTPDKSKTILDDIRPESEDTETYSDKKKFWETVSSSKKEDETPEISVKKRMSLFEEQIFKQEQEQIITKKRTSVHEISMVPPVPKPRSTVAQSSSEEQDSQLQEIREVKETVEEKPEPFVSEYKAAFKDPSLIPDQPPKLEQEEEKTEIIKTESIDSEAEYLKYEHQAYENPGYISESDQELDSSTKEELDTVPKIKRRQMSISQPPVAAARKTIFERSVSLPTEDLQDVSAKSVKARKQYFEQQIKNELVIDQLMTQLEEEEPQEYKTLASTEVTKKVMTPEEKEQVETIITSVRETEKDFIKEPEKKLSPISSSSSQDTKTEDDITQYTPTSVKDLAKYFQPNLMSDYFPVGKPDLPKDTDLSEPSETLQQMQRSSTESEQSISSERSIELGSADEMAAHLAEVLQYKSELSRPSDSLEVHVDKSEIEDSEKVADIEQDENKSFSAEEYLSETESKSLDKIDELEAAPKKMEQLISPIREHKELVVDTTWEVIESQPVAEITESVTDIPIERQVIVERDEELRRDSESCDSQSEKVKSTHSEVEQLLLESLYHQKVNPEDARKIASELVSDIETEIERRNLIEKQEIEDSEPPVPPAEVAKNQISDYLRQLAEAKGLDAKEVELVETVLARKQSELSKLGRHDTQTSSMEITDEDLKYSTEYDMSPSESQENILEEQIEQLEFESQASDLKEKSSIDEVKFSEKSSDSKSKDILAQQDREFYSDDILVALKSETAGTVVNTTQEEKDILKKTEKVVEDGTSVEKTWEQKLEAKSDAEHTDLTTNIEIKTDTSEHLEKVATNILDAQSEQHIEKSSSTKTVTDTSELEESVSEEQNITNISLEGSKDIEISSHQEIDAGFVDISTTETTKATGNIEVETLSNVEHKQETITAEDGSQIISQETKEKTHTKTVTTSQIVDHKREEKTSVTTYIQDGKDDTTATFSDDSKSSTYESAKSPGDQFSSSSSPRKDETDTLNVFDKPEVILRKKLYKDIDTSSSSSNLKIDRRSGADFEAYSSSGESHYQSFEDSARSRPCSSDVEGLIAAGSSEYESALTSQDVSSKSHMTSTEYHTAVSSISSQSMKSLDSESSGHLGSIEVSEASETLVASEVPSNFDVDGDILDGAMSQLLEDEVVDSSDIIEPYDREIPEHVIRGEYQIRDKKSSFDTISDSDIHGESMDISEEDSPHDKNAPGEIQGKMKRSQEMTFQPIPKAIIPDSPQSDALEMDERFGTSLEDGSVLSVSLSSQSDATALRTVIEQSRRDSDRLDASITMSGHDSMSASNQSLDNILPPTSSTTDTSTSTGSHAQESIGSVTLTTSTVDDNGIQSVSTQVTSHQAQPNDVINGPTQVDYVPEYDDVVEPKKVRGHRRQESTSFVPSMIPGFAPLTDKFKTTESAKNVAEMTLKEEHHEETKDVDEMEESYETEADQCFHRQQKESGVLDTESDQDADKDDSESRPQSRISKTDSEVERGMSTAISEDKDSELIALMNQGSMDVFSEPIERPLTPEPPLESRGSIEGIPSLPTTPKSKICGSEKSSIEEGEAEAAFSMVAHISPAHKAKGDICPIMEDEDAEKHELETRERAQKELEKRRAQILRDASPGNIPDIMVTEHMTPLVDREFHYPDLELEEKEALAKSAPQTPASISSKSSEDTDQGREYILDDTHEAIPEEPETESAQDDKQMTESQMTESQVSQSTTVEERTVYEPEPKEPGSLADSPNSDSFEMLEKPDIIDDFVVIEEVAKEAAEQDEEGKSVQIKQIKYIRKHDEEVEEYLVKSAPTPLTRMTDLKYYPDGASSGDELGPFDFEDSPPQAGKKSTGVKTVKPDSNVAQSYGFEYDRELEASKKWIEMQFQGDQAAMISAGYGYEMEFERGPLEDIKEEEATDFESSRIGSLDSQKQSIGSLGSVKDSFSSTPEYDVLAGRKFFTRSGEHDDVSMSSLQEFEHLERVISLENRRHHQGSQDSSSNGSFSKRYQASRSGQGDDISMSSLKEFEGLETACIEAHKIEVIAKEEEALLAQIDEAQENLISESESCKSNTEKKTLPESEEEDYEKRMFEIDEIIKQAQSNVEKFIDMKDIVDKTESMGRGDSLEEVAKVPDLELDEPLVKSTVHTVKWGTEDVMQTSTDSLDQKVEHRASIDSLDMKTNAGDIMTQSTDSIEFQIQSKPTKDNLMTDSIDIPDPDRSYMITSDSLELTPGSLMQLGQMSDSIDEDGSRIGAIGHDQSSSSGFSMSKDEQDMQEQRAEYLLGSTDSLEPTSSTATHATYQYETDSVMSGSFTSGGSNTMVSSTDTIDPLGAQAQGVDLASAVRKVWFDEDAFGAGSHFTTEFLDDGSKPYVTEVIEPCEGDPDYSHTIHRKVQLPPEIKKITFKGPDADLQLRQYIENFGEGEDVHETQETDKDGNIHVKRVVQKRFVVKSDPSGEETRISGPELESYLQKVTHSGDEFDFGLTKQTRTDSGQQHFEGQGEESSIKQLLSSVARDVTQSTTYAEQNLTRHVDKQQEQQSGSSSTTFSGVAAANVLRAQGSRRKPLRFDISVDDQTEVDPREHDWRFILPRHDEAPSDDKPDESESTQTASQLRNVSDQHQLSSEMKELLEEMEKQSKQ